MGFLQTLKLLSEWVDGRLGFSGRHRPRHGIGPKLSTHRLRVLEAAGGSGMAGVSGMAGKSGASGESGVFGISGATGGANCHIAGVEVTHEAAF